MYVIQGKKLLKLNGESKGYYFHQLLGFGGKHFLIMNKELSKFYFYFRNIEWLNDFRFSAENLKSLNLFRILKHLFGFTKGNKNNNVFFFLGIPGYGYVNDDSFMQHLQNDFIKKDK